MSLRIVPLTVSAANRCVFAWHRHRAPSNSGLFAVGVAQDGVVVGAAIVSRPRARMLDDGQTAEVVRLATDGTRNACSKLLGACARAARTLGWRRLITYTLEEEGGASLRAAGWKHTHTTRDESWSRKGRLRTDRLPGRKLRWEAFDLPLVPFEEAAEAAEPEQQLGLFQHDPQEEPS